MFCIQMRSAGENHAGEPAYLARKPTIFFPTQAPVIIHVLIPYLIMTNSEILPANRSTRQLNLSSLWRYKHDNEAAHRMDNVLFVSHGFGQNHATWGRRFPIQQHLHLCLPEDHKTYVNALHTCYDPRQFLCFNLLCLGSEITVAQSVMEIVMKMKQMKIQKRKFRAHTISSN